jgi:hypothetical protein
VAPARARPGGRGKRGGPRVGRGLRSRSGLSPAAPRRPWRLPAAWAVRSTSAPSARALPAPGPAQPRPRPSSLLFGPWGSRPGGARRDDRYGDAGARPGLGLGRDLLPCGRPTRPPRGAGPWELRAERLRWAPASATSAAVAPPVQREAVESLAPHLARLIRGDHRSRRCSCWTQGCGTGIEVPGRP